MKNCEASIWLEAHCLPSAEPIASVGPMAKGSASSGCGKAKAQAKSAPKVVKKEKVEERDQTTSSVLSFITYRAKHSKDHEMRSDATQALQEYKSMAPEAKRAFVQQVASIPKGAANRGKLKLSLLLKRSLHEEQKQEETSNTSWKTIGGVLGAEGYSLKDFPDQETAIATAKK